MTAHLTENELLSKLKDAEKLVKVGATYGHYRSQASRYKVLGLVIIDAAQEVGVAYHKVAGCSEGLKVITWIRPLSSWLETVVHEGKTVARFQITNN